MGQWDCGPHLWGDSLQLEKFITNLGPAHIMHRVVITTVLSSPLRTVFDFVFTGVRALYLSPGLLTFYTKDHIDYKDTRGNAWCCHSRCICVCAWRKALTDWGTETSVMPRAWGVRREMTFFFFSIPRAAVYSAWPSPLGTLHGCGPRT